MRSSLTALTFALLLTACGGGGGADFHDDADHDRDRQTAPLTSDPVYRALAAYSAETRNRNAAGFRDHQRLLDAHAALVRELQEAVAAAGALSNLDVFLDAGGSIGFGAYDTNGIFDPLGRSEDSGPGAPSNPGSFGSFYFLFGPQEQRDPFDVGLPGRRQANSPLMPDVAGAIAGIANSGSSMSFTERRGGSTHTEKIVGENGDVTIRETFYENPQTVDGGMAVTTTETHVTAAGFVDRYSVDKMNDKGQFVYGESWTSDGRLTIYVADDNGDIHTSTIENVEYKDVAVNELSNPDHAPEMGCILPWLCDEQTPGETLMIWSRGANQTLPGGPGEDGAIETRYVAPFLTQFDVLSNPGYIDGLIIYDPSSPDAPSVPRSGPVHE